LFSPKYPFYVMSVLYKELDYERKTTLLTNTVIIIFIVYREETLSKSLKWGIIVAFQCQKIV